MERNDAAWLAACRRFEAMTVAEADRFMTVEPIIVRTTESLQAVASRVVDYPTCRVLSVVDEAGRLRGLLPIVDLAFAAFVHVMPEVFLKYANDLIHSAQFAALSHGRTAGEVMRPPVSVRASDSLERALGVLLEANLEGLPIVDAEGRVGGYLSLVEFLCAWIANYASAGLGDGR